VKRFENLFEEKEQYPEGSSPFFEQKIGLKVSKRADLHGKA
jgi:hypothetical protein